jgi:hypothetical protein
MRHDVLRRAIGAAFVIAAAALLFGNEIVGSTGATFNASTTNTGSAFAGGWVGKPSSGTATASGYDVNLGWTPGSDGPVTGQTIKGTYNGTSSSCSGAAYTDFSFTLGAAVNSTTDANRGVSHNGDWACFEIVSTSATVWTQALTLSAFQLGLAATNVSISNGGGTSNTIEGGDTIAITFNQMTTLSNTSVKVCAFGAPDNEILIGDQKTGNNCGNTGDGYSIGILTTSSTVGGSGTRFTNSGVSVSSSSPWQVAITLGNGGTASVASGATWKFTPAATITTNAPADNAPACTSGSTCQPTTSSSF